MKRFIIQFFLLSFILASCFNHDSIDLCTFDEAINHATNSNTNAIIAVGGINILELASHLKKSINIKDYKFYCCDITLRENMHANYCFQFKEFPSYIIYRPDLGIVDVCNSKEIGLKLRNAHYEEVYIDELAKESERLYNAHITLNKSTDSFPKDFLDSLDTIKELRFYSYYLQYKGYQTLGYSEAEESIQKAIKTYLDNPIPIYSVLFSELLEFSKKDSATILMDNNIDLGSIKQNTTIEHKIPYINIGNEELLIYHASVSCNCISVEWDRVTHPGEKKEIIIRINTSDLTGSFQRTVFLAANTLEGGVLINLSGQTI